MLKNFLINLQNYKILIPLLLLSVCVLSYGILIPTLGLYWDGWPYMLQYHVFGPAGFPQFVASDRPYSAWIFMLSTWLFGTKLIWYHLTILFLRWLSACLVWWMLNLLWEKKWFSNAIIALFFLVYPGFLQQPISLPYLHHISHMALFFFSIWGMLFSLPNPRKYWWLICLSVISSVVVNFSLEYFTPLEILRPIFLYIYFKNELSSKPFNLFKKVLYAWLPYLAGLLFFLGWRIFIFQFPTYSPKLFDQFASTPENEQINPVSSLFISLFTVSLFAWSKVFHFPTISNFGTSATYLYFILIILSAFFLFTTLSLIDKNQKQHNFKSKSKHFEYPLLIIFIGIVSIITPAIMYWILKLPILVEFAWDRLNLSFVFGVSMVMGGLITLIQKTSSLKFFIVAIITSLAIGFHFQNGMAFKRDWESFQDFFWQLTWRAPDLKKGTIILTTDFPLHFYSDNSLTAPLNWIYDPENKTSHLNYLFYFTDVRLKSKRLISLSDNLSIQQPYRSFSFEGNTNQSLVLKYSPPGCLQILDNQFSNSGVIPNLSQLEAEAIKLSKLAQIEPQPLISKKPPFELFGQEPAHDWCYHFEKADLARQNGDWQSIIKFGNDAIQRGLSPRNLSEWLPFIEAYLRTGDVNTAKLLIDSSVKDERYQSGICFTLKRIRMDAMTNEKIITQILQWEEDYNCRK